MSVSLSRACVGANPMQRSPDEPFSLHVKQRVSAIVFFSNFPFAIRMPLARLAYFLLIVMGQCVAKKGCMMQQ